jgi:hypothetical protein
MEVLAGLSVVVLILTALAVAIKTFGLWLRSRQLPELLLSGMLVSATVIGYPLAVACNQIAASDVRAIHIAYPLAFNLGYVCLLLFTLRVFRAEAGWAKGLVAATLVVLAGSAAAYIVEASSAHPRPPAQLVGLSLVNSAGIAVVYFWTTFESLGYYRRLRLQQRLGLTRGELVVNRFLLWGLMGAAAGLAVLINAGSIVLGSFMSPPIVATSSALGLVHAGCLFLAFHPPAWYRAWVEQRFAVQPA